MKLFSLLLAIVFAGVIAFASAAAPVTVLKAEPHGRAHRECPFPAPCYNSGVDMTIEYQNTGDKVVEAVKFKVIFVDSVGDTHDPMQTYTSNKKLAPGKKYTARWENLLFPDAKRMEVTPVKVAYTDGSVWQADAQ